MATQPNAIMKIPATWCLILVSIKYLPLFQAIAANRRAVALPRSPFNLDPHACVAGDYFPAKPKILFSILPIP
jgi:hypothetical protein